MAHRRRATTDDLARLRVLFRDNPLPMWVYDIETLEFLEVNEAAEVQYGYSRDEFLAMRITDIRPLDDVPRLLEDIAAKRPRLQSSGEWRHRGRDGRIIDVHITSHTLTYSGRRAALIVAQDITERKRAEEALRKSEARYRGLFNGVPVGLFRATAGGEPLEANPAFLRMLGCPDLEALRARDAADLYVDPEVRRRWIATLEREGIVSGYESQLRRPDGSIIWARASARMVHDASSGVTYLEGAVEDITERKRVEEAFLRAREADRASQAKSEFLSRMSHELRTPLNAILGFAQLLEMDSLNPEQQKSVAYILAGGRHLLGLINEVLDIARIEAGRLPISLEPVQLPGVVREALDLAASLAANMNVRLRGGEAIPDRHILADNQRLKQVLLNLLSNAIKYNRQGGTVTVAYEDAAGGRLRIKVSDVGPGIPPDRMERLFTPFERLGAEKTDVEGTGLGLALSKRLVEAMGGSMGVESAVGQGSTFWAEFPLAESPNAQVQRGGQEVRRPAELDAPSKAGVVLYIEDNLSNVKLIEKLLIHRPDVRLMTAMQGQLGLDLARQHLPDLVLLDLQLPDIPGDEVLRRLRATPETRDLPVVMISADATPRQIERLRAAGALAYLTKPLEVQKLLALVDEILGRESGVGLDKDS